MPRLGLTAVLALAVVACNDSNAPAPIHDLDAIQIGVRVTPATLVAGDPAEVRLTLRNTLTRPVVISQCPIYYWVESGGGQIVGGSNAIGCLAGTFVWLPLRFGPLETKTVDFSWTGIETQSVPPGAYDVFGWVDNPARRSAPARITVQSSN